VAQPLHICRENGCNLIDFNKMVLGNDGYLEKDYSTVAIGLNNEWYGRISLTAHEILRGLIKA